MCGESQAACRKNTTVSGMLTPLLSRAQEISVWGDDGRTPTDRRLGIWPKSSTWPSLNLIRTSFSLAAYQMNQHP
jgi:hypothetical protein